MQDSKRSSEHLAGRNDGNTKVIMPKGDIPWAGRVESSRDIQPGDYVVVQVGHLQLNYSFLLTENIYN